MAKKKTQKKSRRKSIKKKKLTGIRAWPWRKIITIGAGVIFFCLVLFAIWLFFHVRSLNEHVTTQFEGRRWELPARVYARPQDLYVGKQVSLEQFKDELALLGYREQKEVTQPGEYRIAKDSVEVYLRAFPFPDEAQESTHLTVSFNQKAVSRLQHIRKSKALDLIRMEPALIANIYPKNNEDRVLVQRHEVPELLVQALLTVEDREFYEHNGVRFTSILRALLANIRAGRTVQGGSTLTQQLVKNFYLTSERKYKRKFNEALMAWILEWHYSKDEILSVYMNEIFLGQQGNRAIHGFGLASYFYFQRPLHELQADQIALLVALVKGASWYEPRRNPERALERRNLVLDSLESQGQIASELVTDLKLKQLGVTPKAPVGVSAFPGFLQLVREQLKRDYKEEDLRSEGLVIFTTLDPIVQMAAENSSIDVLDQREKDLGLPTGTLETATVVTSVDQGEVLAVIGGRDPRYPGFNRALETRRPIGSLVKPMVFLTALQKRGMTLASIIADTPLVVEQRSGDWQPQNYDGEFRGAVRMIDALVHSYNVPTARLGMEVGVKNVRKTLQLTGAQSEINSYPSILLGSVELPPIEVAQMYQTLAANGYRTPLRSILQVVNPSGEVLTRYPLNLEQVISTELDYLVVAAMHEVTVSGTARRLQQLLPDNLSVAGKTGTTDQLRDSWFAGFSGEHVIISWVGRDDNQPTGLTGSSGAMLVWAEIMNNISTRALQPVQPNSVEWQLTDITSGTLADPRCPGTQWLPFIKGTEPALARNCVDDRERNEQQTLRGFQWLRDLIN